MAADGEQPGGGEGVDAGGAAAIAHAAPWYGDIKDADTKAWMEKNNPPDPETFAKGYRNLEKMVGTNRLSLPGEKDDITQWKGWDELKVPTKAEEYKLNRPQLPEGMTWNDGFEKTALEAAAKARAPQHVVQAMLDAFAQEQIGHFNAGKQLADKDAADVQQLFKDWGADKDNNIIFVQRAAKFLGLEQAETLSLTDGLLGGPTVLKGLLKIGKSLREGAAIDGGNQNIMGAEAAKAELARLNERIGKGETLNADEMKRRDALYAQAYV